MVSVATVVLVPGEVGTALAHPPKSSSAATVGAGFEAALEDGTPQPAPMSLAVNVSGTFIIDSVLEGTGGAGSGVLQASAPQGFAENMLVAVEVAAETSAFGGGTGLGLERLKADFKSGCGDFQPGGCGAGLGAEGGGLLRPNGSLDGDDWKVCAVFAGVGLVNTEPRPLEDTDAVRCCGWGGRLGDVRLSNKLPPLMEEVREVT